MIERNLAQPIGKQLCIRQGNLPHWQMGGSVYFVTFRSARGSLPDAARGQVVENILYDHQRKYHLYCAVVMPDHVHLPMRPLEEKPDVWYDLSAILKSLKGVSSRRVNQLLHTTGTVWQGESFDRIVRDEEEFYEKWDYIHNNPVEKGLVEKAEDYPYLTCPFDPEQE